MRKYLRIDRKACVGCRTCQVTCSLAKAGFISQGESAVQFEWKDMWQAKWHIAVCLQCRNAKCMDACPSEALYRNEMGVVCLDKAKCTGCGDCVRACNFKAIKTGMDGYPVKCDLCHGKTYCVNTCPVHAIKAIEE